MLSILLALTMVFAILSIQKDDNGIELLASNDCDSFCCLQRCETHIAKLDVNRNIIFNSKVVSKEQLVQHLKQVHSECEQLNVSIVAAPMLEHQFVVGINNFIKTESPNSVVAWSMNN